MATTVTLKPNAIDISGSTSGTTTLQATAVAGTTTLTLPAATDTLVGRTTTDTLTNKTLTGAVMNGTLGATTPSTVAATTVQIGTNPAGVSIGVLGIPNQKRIYGRNAANSADVNILYVDGSNGLVFGPSDAATIDSSGNLGIGITNPVGRLNVKSTYVSDTATQQRFEDNTGVSLNFGGTGGGKKFIQAQDTAGSATYYDVLINPLGGNLLVGTTSQPPSGTNKTVIQVDGSGNPGLNVYYTGTGAYNQIVLENGNGVVGRIQTSGSATSYLTSSDYRLKENVAPMTGALSKVAQLKPITYKWKTDGLNGQGFIAHELQEVIPDCVGGDKDAVDADGNPVYQGIDTSFLVATLTAAIQEQQALITQLQADVAALKGA